jgi:hypothetical protein
VSLIKRIAGLLPARRTLHVHLGPQSLLAVLRQDARIADGGTLHVGFANPAGQWQVPLAALRALLAQPGQAYAADMLPGASSGGTDGSAGVRAALADRLPLHVSLSGRWCQMLMAPWSDALLSEAGIARFLETQFAAIYGDAARGWP